MRFRTVAATAFGVGVGYVLGAKAGRARFDELKAQAQRIVSDPDVRQKVADLPTQVKENLPKAQAVVSDAIKGAGDKLQGKADSAQDAVGKAKDKAKTKVDETKDKVDEAKDKVDEAKDKAGSKDKADEAKPSDAAAAGAFETTVTSDATSFDTGSLETAPVEPGTFDSPSGETGLEPDPGFESGTETLVVDEPVGEVPLETATTFETNEQVDFTQAADKPTQD